MEGSSSEAGTAVWKQPRLKLKAATNDVVFNEEINVHGLPNAFELLDEDEDVVTNATSASFADGLFIRFEGNLYSLTVPAKSSAAPQGCKLDNYRFTANREPSSHFEQNGFGPFTVERKALRKEIVDFCRTEGKGWARSVHINGCKGSGKTLLLHMIGEDLLKAGSDVYYFRTSEQLDNAIDGELEKMDGALKKRAYVLVDESQDYPKAAAFTFLLKSAKKLTVIAAGVPPYESISGSFQLRKQPEHLFLTLEELETEGILKYFYKKKKKKKRKTIIKNLLLELHGYTGGHIFPLMRLAEVLVPLFDSDDIIAHFHSSKFRTSDEFEKVLTRVVPSILSADVRQLFQKGRDNQQVILRLSRLGFCTSGGKILSPLLVEAHLASLSPSDDVISNLAAGVSGIQQLLMFALPKLELDDYSQHGGPVEDALTFELLAILAQLQQVDKRLFQPKLVDAGTAARRPDAYLNSTVNSYLECLLIKSNNETEKKSLDEHIRDFYEAQPKRPNETDEAYNHRKTQPHYQLGDGQDFAILNFQNVGTEPIQPSSKWKKKFNERVFTFIMPSQTLFLGVIKVQPDTIGISKRSRKRKNSAKPAKKDKKMNVGT